MEPEICMKCGSPNIVFVEYEHSHPDHYDGVSEIVCKDCGIRIGRWSEKELAEGETEKRYGTQK